MLTVFSWQQLKNQQDIVCFNLMFHFDVCHCKKREFQLLSWICGGSLITASGLLLRVTYLLLWRYCNVLSSVTIGWPSSGISAHTHCSLQEVIPSSTLCTYLICYTLPHKKISTWLYHSSYCRTRLPAAIIFSHLIVITKPDSLFEDDLGGSLAVHAEVPIGQLDDSAHWQNWRCRLCKASLPSSGFLLAGNPASGPRPIPAGRTLSCCPPALADRLPCLGAGERRRKRFLDV